MGFSPCGVDRQVPSFRQMPDPVESIHGNLEELSKNGNVSLSVKRRSALIIVIRGKAARLHLFGESLFKQATHYDFESGEYVRKRQQFVNVQHSRFTIC